MRVCAVSVVFIYLFFQNNLNTAMKITGKFIFYLLLVKKEFKTYNYSLHILFILPSGKKQFVQLVFI